MQSSAHLGTNQVPAHAPVLIAEDDPNDVFLLRRAFQKAGLSQPVVVLRNGQELVDYLALERDSVSKAERAFPALLFLDLKMPLLDGFDVLAWLRQHPLKKQLPIVVLTSSNQEKDIHQAREMGASDYRVKPQQFEDLVEIVRQVSQRWIAHATSADQAPNP